MLETVEKGDFELGIFDTTLVTVNRKPHNGPGIPNYTFELDLFEMNITSITREAFIKCKQFVRQLVLPEGLKEIGCRTFSDCIALQEVVFPKSLEKVGEMAFSGCVNLTAAVFLDGLKRIERYAFENCDSLARLVLPQSLEHIGDYAFFDCKQLKIVEFLCGKDNRDVSSWKRQFQSSVMMLAVDDVKKFNSRASVFSSSERVFDGEVEVSSLGHGF